MAIKNSIRYTLLGMGTAGLRGGVVSVTTPLGTTMTATVGPLAQRVNLGAARVRVSGLTGTGAVSSIVITGSDGTTTVYLASFAVTGGVANQGVDFMSDFQSELNLTTLVATVTFSAAPTAALIDFEAWGQENAGGM